MDESTQFPTGTVTFLFADIPVHGGHLDRDAGEIVAAEAADANGHRLGLELGSLAFVFATALDAVQAAVGSQRRISGDKSADLACIGLHTGEVDGADGVYAGAAANRASRLASAAHRGQILASGTTASVLDDIELPGIGFIDLGPHRLRGLARPVTVHQVVAEGLSATFDPLSGVDRVPHNLPALDRDLVGRDREVQQTVEALAKRHLVTIAGVGGIGKTRLALEVAVSLIDEFPDGVWFCPLAPATDASSLVHLIGQSLEVQQHPGRSMADTIAEFCRQRRLLLVLDNCEHVLDAAAELTASVLATAKDTRILTTSREALQVASEQVIDLQALSNEGDESPAVELFRSRVFESGINLRWSEADTHAAHRICRRLDGLPLAIELAAGRAATLPLQEIEQQLDRASGLLRGSPRSMERHRSLTAAIDWSYQLLSDVERALFTRLSVFAGSFDLDAAVSVGTGHSVERTDLVDTLDGLRAKSLVMAEVSDDGIVRYRLLEPIRQFADMHLAGNGDSDAAKSAHASHFSGWVDEWDQSWWSATDAEPARNLARELPNLRAAVRWAIDSEDVDTGLRVLAKLSHAVISFGFYEVGQWCLELLELPTVDLHPLAPRASQCAYTAYSTRGEMALAEQVIVRAEAMAHYDPSESEGCMRALRTRWVDVDVARSIGLLGRVTSSPRVQARATAAWLRVLFDPTDVDVDTYVSMLRRDADSFGGPVEAWAEIAAAVVHLHRANYAEAAEHARLATVAAERVGARNYGAGVASVLGVAAGVAGTLSPADVATMSAWLREHREAQHLSQWDSLIGSLFALVTSGHSSLAADILRSIQGTPPASRFETQLVIRLLPEAAAEAKGREPVELDALVDRVLEVMDEIVDASNDRAAPPVRLITLGRFALEVDGEEVPTSVWRSRRARQLCKRLAAAQGWPVTRDQLIELLWPEDPAVDRLGARLSVQLSAVRRALGGGIVSDRQTVRLDLEAVTCDLEDLYAADDDDSITEIYAGEFLPEDLYEDWTNPPRNEARARFVAAAYRLADAAVGRGDHERVVGLARRLIEADRYDERARHMLITSLSTSGAIGDARRAYDHWVADLSELGVSVPPFEQVTAITN